MIFSYYFFNVNKVTKTPIINEQINQKVYFILKDIKPI